MKKLRLNIFNGNIFLHLLGLSVLVFSCKKNDDMVTPPPSATIASVTGPTGLTSGAKNTVITITGTNFITDISKIQVKVNGKACIVLSATATSITAQIPPACGTGVVELFLDGVLFTGPVFTFVYTYTLSSVTNGQVGYIDGPLATARLEEIVGISIDGNDNIYTAQYNKPRVRKIGADGLVSTMAGDGTLGTVNGNGTSAKLGQADFVSSDAAGNIYLAENNNGSGINYIRKIDVNKNVTNFVSGTPGASFEGIKVMPGGNIYVTDAGSNKIGKITTAGVLTWIAVSNGYGDIDGPVGTAKFTLYGGIEVSPDEKKIYVCEYGNGFSGGSKVKLFDVTANTITTIAGKTGLTDGDGDALNVGFKLVTTVLLDNTGGLYIASGNHKIKYLKNGTVTTFIGASGNGDVDGDISIAKINYPHGLVWDSKGNMFIGCASGTKLKKLTID